MPLLIFGRRYADVALEHPREIVGVLKAEHIGDLVDAVLPLLDQLTGTAAFFRIDKVNKVLVVLLFEQGRQIPRRQADIVRCILQHNTLVHIVPHILARLFQQGGASGGVALAQPGQQRGAYFFQPCQHLRVGGQKLDAEFVVSLVQQRGRSAVDGAAKPKRPALLVGDRAHTVNDECQQLLTGRGIFGAYIGSQLLAHPAQCQRLPCDGRVLPVEHGIAARIIVIIPQGKHLIAALLQILRSGKAVCAQHSKNSA